MIGIVKYCCKEDSTSVLSIDTTFNFGKFFLTSTTYQNQNFLHQRTGKFSNLPGPGLLRVCEDESLFF